MRRVRLAICLIVVCAMALANTASADTFGSGANQFTIDFVPISGSTNPGSGIPAGYGFTFTGVDHDYRMGTYEVSNAQWTKFKANLSPVIVTGSEPDAYDRDPYFTGLNVPTNEVSWYEAAQFVNYLNTSTNHTAAYKFTGTQGTSGYTLGVWQSGDVGYSASNPYRNSKAYYFLPTENEWVKAAYWNSTNSTLQTYSNAFASDLVSGSPDPARWNYDPSTGYEPWNVTSGSQELNGTYNMMGNVLEWMESPYSTGDYLPGCSRSFRGGSCYDDDYRLASSHQSNVFPDYEYYVVGFRVASVPEPATLLLLGLGGIILRRRSV